MSVADLVRSAANPQAAMLAIAEALDRIEAAITDLTIGKPDLDAWGHWPSTQPKHKPVGEVRPIAEVEANEDEVIVTFTKTDDPERIIKREQLSEAMALADELGAEVDYAFVQYGPYYLYEYDRDFVMQQAPELRALLVEDLAADDPKRAHEMGRDILKSEKPGVLPSLGD